MRNRIRNELGLREVKEEGGEDQTQDGATPSFTVSEGRYADSEDTAALPVVERLPAVK